MSRPTVPDIAMTEIELKELISQALSTPTDHAPYFVGRALAELYPDRHVLFGRNHEFRVTEFARQSKCHLVMENVVFNLASTSWQGPSQPLSVWPENALFNESVPKAEAASSTTSR